MTNLCASVWTNGSVNCAGTYEMVPRRVHRIRSTLRKALEQLGLKYRMGRTDLGGANYMDHRRLLTEGS